MIDYKKVPWEVWAIGGGIALLWASSKIWSAKDVGNTVGSTVGGAVAGTVTGLWDGIMGIVDGIGNSLNDAFATSNGGNALNPANPENPINTGFNWLYDSSGVHTLGGDIYDLVHGNWSELMK